MVRHFASFTRKGADNLSKKIGKGIGALLWNNLSLFPHRLSSNFSHSVVYFFLDV